MNIERDLKRIAQQEACLRYTRFDASDAWRLGCRLQALAAERKASVAIEIRVNGQRLFFCAMPGATPSNEDWIRRKSHTVDHFRRSSYAVGLGLNRDQTTLEAKIGASTADFATHGGSFPIALTDSVCIGSVTVSGLPQRQDHALVVEALCDCLNQPLSSLALEE
ncbi:heme-degrading domain-containing protein [Paludibacterium yongneupense]|uniref:heme-degrading domain-containing protein n=1 Tax=Paludibacterium yongneupense TaxID=400061 RepID=UPI00041E4FF1|nr:heme-degrading domain-containing protein [Paludibacterium yongneupense]